MEMTPPLRLEKCGDFGLYSKVPPIVRFQIPIFSKPNPSELLAALFF